MSEICARAFNEKKNSFVQAYGSDELDAGLLLMPLVGFLPASDPRVKGTVEAIEREFMPDGLVLRYDTSKVQDGLASRRRRLPGLQLLDGQQPQSHRAA